MMTWLTSILDGFKVYGSIAPVIALVLILRAFAQKKLNIVRFIIDQMTVAYLICVIMLVFFPLPTMERAAALCEYHGRFLPGSFIFDIAKEKSLESVLQVLFNIVMTVPFGMILTYRFGLTKRQVILYSFLLSLFSTSRTQSYPDGTLCPVGRFKAHLQDTVFKHRLKAFQLAECLTAVCPEFYFFTVKYTF